MVGNNFSKKFEQAITRVLKNEGGYTNDQYDGGGETKFGISKRSYPNLDIRSLTLDGAKLIYYRDFWAPQHYEQINSFAIAEKIFDLAVNVGTPKAHIVLQRALRAVGFRVKEDGILGKITLAAINAANENALLAAIRSESAGYYRSIVAANSSQSRFINGWLNRSYT